MDMEIGIYLPGIRIKTSPTDFAPMEQLRLMRFKGEIWDLFGPLMDGSWRKLTIFSSALNGMKHRRGPRGPRRLHLRRGGASQFALRAAAKRF